MDTHTLDIYLDELVEQGSKKNLLEWATDIINNDEAFADSLISEFGDAAGIEATNVEFVKVVNEYTVTIKVTYEVDPYMF